MLGALVTRAGGRGVEVAAEGVGAGDGLDERLGQLGPVGGLASVLEVQEGRVLKLRRRWGISAQGDAERALGKKPQNV